MLHLSRPDETIGLVNVGISMSWCFAYFQETLASGTMDDPLRSDFSRLVDFKGVPTTRCVKILWECHLSKSLYIYIYLFMEVHRHNSGKC